MSTLDLTHHFLIAMPMLDDPNFSRTVTYLCAHNDEGAMGIIINRPIGIELREVLAQMKLTSDDPAISRHPVFQGGPVHRDRGFIIHRPTDNWDSTIRVTKDIGVSTSRDILEAISNGKGPKETLIALGYAGWGAGQLEYELAQNAWLSAPAAQEIIFRTPPDQRWQEAAARVGVDLSILSNDVGHA